MRLDITRVHGAIRPYIRETPVLATSGSDVGLGRFPLTLKLEFLQHSGSFKVRGAFANLLTRAIPPSGVAAASGGNHGAAVAYAANRLGIAARIFVPTVVSAAKLACIRACGAGDRHRRSLCRCARRERAIRCRIARPADPRLRPAGNAARPGHPCP